MRITELEDEAEIDAYFEEGMIILRQGDDEIFIPLELAKQFIDDLIVAWGRYEHERMD